MKITSNKGIGDLSSFSYERKFDKDLVNHKQSDKFMDYHSIKAVAKVKIKSSTSNVFMAFHDSQKMSKFWFTRRDEGLETGEKIPWFINRDNKEFSFYVDVKVNLPHEKIVIEWPQEDGKYTHVTFNFKKTEDGYTNLTIEETGFTGTNEEIVERALDSTGGFNQVIIAAKAFIEYGDEINVVKDHI